MKKSPLEGASNQLNDDAVGNAVGSGSRKSTLAHLVQNWTGVDVFLGNKEDADCGISIFVESDDSRLTSLMQKITISSGASHQCGIREESNKTELGTEEFSLLRVHEAKSDATFQPTREPQKEDN